MGMLAENTDASISARLQNGDESAFRVIYDEIGPKIYYFVYKFVKNKEQAEEIVQETFLRLWLNREKLNSLYPPEALLYTISRRLTLNFMRNTANHHAAFKVLVNDLGSSENQTEEWVFFADLKRVTDNVIDKLPRQQQVAFRLSRMEGLNYDEIADQMKISRNTVKNHLVQAAKSVKLHFLKNDIIYFLLLYLFIR